MTAKRALLQPGRKLHQLRMDKNFSLEVLSVLSGVAAVIIKAIQGACRRSFMNWPQP